VGAAWDTRQRRKAAGEAQGAREPAEILESDGVFLARPSPGDPTHGSRSVSSPEFAAIGKPDKQAITPIAPHSPNGLARGVAASNGNLALQGFKLWLG